MSRSSDRRVRLLGGQTFLLGLLSGLIVIPASSAFLDEFGAANLPWAYIAGAMGAMVGTPLLSRAVGRWSLATIAFPVWVSTAVGTLSGWALLEWQDARWVSAPLYVAFPLVILIGFFLVGGQAGRLFDVREMKERFPRVVVGFPAGFLVAGLTADALITGLGGVHRVLPAASLTALVLGALTLATRHHFVEELGFVSPRARASARPSLRHLVRDRYVALLLGYQMLSQLGTQLVDFLVFERAAARFAGVDELGTFVARFTTGLNLIDLVFLFFVAGWLLRRFGMRAGLSLNPAVVTALVLGAVAVGFADGMGSTLVLLLVLAARVFDIAFTDGATRTALNMAYQAVPAGDRLPVQAAIEGLGVPVAIGLTGVILLVMNQQLGVGALGISVLTVAVGLVWTGAGFLVFRAYRVRLRQGLEHRVLAPTALDLSDPVTRSEIDNMLGSGDERQVWLAVMALGDHPQRTDRLVDLASSGAGRVAQAAFQELVATAPLQADRLAPVLAAEASAIGVLARAWLGELEGLRDGLRSRDAEVRSAALTAVALAGDAAIPIAAAALVAGGREAISVVRALVPSVAVAELLTGQVEHPEREVALAARQMLARCGLLSEPDGLVSRIVVSDVSYAARALVAIEVLPESAIVLRRTLADEVDLAGRLALAALGMAGGSSLAADVSRILRRRDGRATAHAIETLELHLEPGLARMVIPLIDGRLSPADRLVRLGREVDVPRRDLDQTLADLLDDPEGVWRRPWIRECVRQTAIGPVR